MSIPIQWMFPRVRGDLVLSPQPAGEGTALIVKDPACGRFFRFREIEAFILTRLDGATAPDVIRADVEERFHAPLPASTFESFLQRLARLSLLESSDSSQASTARRDHRIRGTAL